MAAEFDLITRYFARATAGRDDVVAGIGDDAALVVPPPGSAIVSVCTTLQEGIDFPPGSSPAGLGRRAVEDGLHALDEGRPAGSAPRAAWALLGLTLPAPDEDWTRAFAAGLAAACRDAGIELVGGDTTRGPRSVTCILHGIVSEPE